MGNFDTYLSFGLLLNENPSLCACFKTTAMAATAQSVVHVSITEISSKSASAQFERTVCNFNVFSFTLFIHS